MRANLSTSTTNVKAVPDASLLPHLSWAKLDATECDVNRDLKFILCEQDFINLCGTQYPNDGPQNFLNEGTLQLPPDKTLPPTAYFQGRDDKGNCIKVCVISEAPPRH